MALSGRIAQTGFEQNPKKEAVLVDPYKPKQINSLNAVAPAIEAVTNPLDDKLPAERAELIKNDPQLASELATTGLTLDQYVSNIERNIPASADTTQLFRDYPLTVLARDSVRAVDAIRSKSIDVKDVNFFSTTIGYMQKAGSVVDLDAYAKDLSLGQVTGNSNAVDKVADIATSLGLVKTGVLLGQVSGFYDLLGDNGEDEVFGRFAVEEAITLAAKEGSYQAVKDILTSYPKQASTNLRKQAVTWILENFSTTQANLEGGYYSAAKEMVDALNAISPNWLITKLSNGTEVYNHKIWLKASQAAVELLRYDTRTQLSADLQKQKRYRLETWLPEARKQYPKTIFV